MEKASVTRTVSNKQVGGTQVQKEEIVTDEGQHPDFALAKVAQLVWYVIHFIAIVLGLRFAFLLFGANITGIVSVIYNFSSLFVMPFSGIFPSPRMGESFFDSASLIGIVLYYLLLNYQRIRTVIIFN
jgi:hypothetical protein